jgi:ankyrin repeat protein
VELLLQQFNADALAKNEDGNTPLHLAAENNRAEVLRVLVAFLGEYQKLKNNVCEPSLAPKELRRMYHVSRVAEIFRMEIPRRI